MYEFKFSRPATVRQAANLLAKTEDAKLIAGGHTLVPVMKQRLARPAQLIDLSKIEGLDTIEMKGRSLVIGAMARHASVASSAVAKANIPALANLASMIGDPADMRVGMGRSQEIRIGLAGTVEIVDIAPLSDDEALVLLATHRGADACGVHGSLPYE